MEHPGVFAHQGYISNILLNDKQVGDVLQVSHPAGEFSLGIDHDECPIVLISDGVGLTPMLSIPRSLDEHKATQPVSWIHATRNSKVQAFGKDVKIIAQRRPNVRSHVFIKYPSDSDAEGMDCRLSGRMSLGKLDREGDLFLNKQDAE